jgi:hypothetical protein
VESPFSGVGGKKQTNGTISHKELQELLATQRGKSAKRGRSGAKPIGQVKTAKLNYSTQTCQYDDVVCLGEMATSTVHVGDESRPCAVKTTKPRGIVNPNNLCYLISSLQCHLQNPHFEQILLRIQCLLHENNESSSPVQFVCALCEFLEESKLQGRHPIRLNDRIIETLHIDVCNQEDPMEVSIFSLGQFYFLCSAH